MQGTGNEASGMDDHAHISLAISPLDGPLHDFGALIDGAPTDRAGLATALEDAYRAISFARVSDIPPDTLRANGHDICEALFATQAKVRANLQGWHAAGAIGPITERRLRDIFRYCRNAIERVGECALDHPRLGADQSPMRAFSGGAPFCSRAVAGQCRDGDIKFQDGDILVQRGRRHNSAAIARIGELDSQFSHVSVVAHDRDGAQVAVEALIEDGAVCTPLDEALAHGIGRAMLFRYRDHALARAAAEYAYERVARSQPPLGTAILYDFTMELAGYDKLFCAKLVRMAFDGASSGRVMLPSYPTRLTMKNRDFLKRIGVTAQATFSPGDLELEPDFELIAEWRDFRMTSELRLKDFVVIKIFEWMELYGFRFRPDIVMLLIGLLGRLSTHLSDDARAHVAELAGKVPPNMSRTAIAAVAMLHQTAEPMYRELQLLEDETIRVTGRQLTPSQAFRALETYRARHGDRVGYLARL